MHDMAGRAPLYTGSVTIPVDLNAKSFVTGHTSHITRHTSHVTHHTSHNTRHTSHITHLATLAMTSSSASVLTAYATPLQPKEQVINTKLAQGVE